MSDEVRSLKWGSSYSVKTKAYSYALYRMYAQPLLIGASGMGIDVTEVTLLPWIPRLRNFLAGKFVLSMIIRIFAAREPAKPLNDAQMCGSFLFLWVYGNKDSVYKNIFLTPWVSAASQNKRYGDNRWGKGSALSFPHRLLSFVCLYVPIAFYSQGTASIQARSVFR